MCGGYEEMNCPDYENSLDIKEVAGVNFYFCEVCGYEGERIDDD